MAYNGFEQERNSFPLSVGSQNNQPQEPRQQVSIATILKGQNATSTLVVIAAFVVMFTSCGLNFAFGVYQELYESMSSSPDPNPFTNASPALISLIGTLALSSMSLGAPFASAWSKSYSPRTIILMGGLIFALSNVLASFCYKFWQFLLTQGMLLGIGTCMTYIPAVTVAPGWFTTHRGLAVGVLSSGTGVGGLVWAPVLRTLNTNIGFRNTLRLTGAVSLLPLAFSAMILKWEPEIERRNNVELQSSRSRFLVQLIDWRVARSRKFVAQLLSAALQASAYYAPLYFLSAYGRTLGYSAAEGAKYIALSNASSAVSKIVIGWTADRVGRLNVLLFTTFISAVTVFGLWLPSMLFGIDQNGRPLFVAFTILFGIFAGAYISLFPTTLVELFGVQHFASVNGFLYMARGAAALVGVPTAGALIRGDYGSEEVRTSQAYFQTSSIIGSLLVGTTLGVAWVRIEASLGMTGRPEERTRRWRA
ncbi:putative MFS monocarboxylate transporter [Zopfia rhizophila CBS 207.26]|uniref:Putative MFS monocarboxylate transporter n=1 Tax=Zopfia rhizophila CBS 207.26 TaxID=1314779 RepID=A0A6A6EJL4_9PEZI|nr:putative MFS monocarboxylate transporter [Zopfia rhizophila CBS 207.26]